MDLVERIEIIRGPKVCSLQIDGILANLNVVTHSPVEVERLRVSAETDSEEEHKQSLVSGIQSGA